MTPNWDIEFNRIVLLMLAVLLAGAVTGQWGWCVGAGAGGYAIWQLAQLWRIERWLRTGVKQRPAPDCSGMWHSLVQQIYQMQQRHDNRKQRLTAIVSRFQSSTEALPMAAIVMGNEYQIRWANGAAERLLGIRSAQDHGQILTNLLRDPGFLNYLRLGSFEESLVIQSPTRSDVQLEARLVPYGNEGEILLIARDISSDLRLQAVRRDFVANVSHELRTPLTVIAGYVETLGDFELPPDVQSSVEAIARQAYRMKRIVEDLLLLSGLQMEPEPSLEQQVPVPSLLHALCEDARRLSADKQHTILAAIEPTLEIQGSETELMSAFSNLINNAVQHTPASGRITVEWQRDGRGARFEVRDSGPGISAEHLPRLTERFYRVDKGRSRATGGTGLGLSITKHVLARHDAHLSISSEPGKGSSFVCRFGSARVASTHHSREPAA